MPRGFKRDEAATAEAGFEHYRSFVSMPKAIEGGCAEPKPHLLLHGDDKAPIRAEIFRRNREANGGICKCVKCGRRVYEEAVFPDPERGEWHHIRNKSGERCDCPENGEVRCSFCHRQAHVMVKFNQQSEDVERESEATVI